MLNEENAELKDHNQRLQDEVQSLSVAKDRLEDDMKQVNLNLMDQLHKRTLLGKDLEKRLQEAEEGSARESRRSTESLTRAAALDAENALLRENIRVLHEQCTSVTRQLALAEESVAQSNAQQSTAAAAAKKQFEEDLASFRRHSEEAEGTIASLQQRLAHVTAEKGSLENTFNDLHNEHLALQEAYGRDVADAKAQSRRAAATDADVSYLHGQLLDHKTEVAELFGAMRHYVQPLGEECERHGEEVGRLATRMTALADAFAAVRSADDNVLVALHSQIGDLHRQLNDAHAARAKQHEAYSELERHSQSLGGQLARYKAEVGHLTLVFSELQEAVSQSQSEISANAAALSNRDRHISELSAAVAAEQRLNSQMRLELEQLRTDLGRSEDARQHVAVELAREKSEAVMRMGHAEQEIAAAKTMVAEQSRLAQQMRGQYENEIQGLRLQVDEHADTLASALGRLRSGSAHPNHRNAAADMCSAINSRATSMASTAPRSKSEGFARPSSSVAVNRLDLEEGRVIEMD